MNNIFTLLLRSSISASVLVLLVFALRFIFKKKLQPSFRYALWIVVAIKLMIPFSFQWSIEIEPVFPQVHILEAALLNNYETYEAGDSNQKLSNNNIVNPTSDGVTHSYAVIEILLYLWIIGIVTVLVLFSIRNILFHKKIVGKLEAYPLSSDGCNETFDSLRIKSKIPVRVTKDFISPCVIGVFRTSIVLTDNITKDADAMKFALMHEMIHCKHKDNLARLLANILCAVYWFNPLVWLAAKAARNDAELFCDSVVLKKIGEHERFGYGLTLLSVAGKKSIATAMSGGGRNMKARIDMIVKQPEGRRASLVVIALCLAFCLASFVNVKVNADSGSIQRTGQQITLGQIYDVYNLASSLSVPNDNYIINTYIINNSDEDKGLYAPVKSLWLRYELDHGQSPSELTQYDRSIMDANALRLFELIPDLNAVTFSFIDKPADSDIRNEESPFSYLYCRDEAIPQTDSSFWQSKGANHVVIVYGYSEILAAAGLNEGEFEESRGFAEKVLSELIDCDKSWDSHGSTVYCFSPNTIYRNWSDLTFYIDSGGKFEGHGIILPN